MADFIQRIGLRDKVAIVVGGGRGIGRSCSIFLAEAGAHVALLELEAARAESVAAEIRAIGRRALPIVADAWNADQVDRTVRATLAEFGGVDVLVNDVGLSTVVASEDSEFVVQQSQRVPMGRWAGLRTSPGPLCFWPQTFAPTSQGKQLWWMGHFYSAS